MLMCNSRAILKSKFLDFVMLAVFLLLGVGFVSIGTVQAKVFPKIVPIKAPDNTVKIKTEDDFILSAQYFSGDEEASGVIVLHHCKSSSKAYMSLAKQLKVQKLHVLMIDLRGYGDSASKDFSHEKMKTEATDIVTYQASIAYLSAFWVDDLLSATKFLQRKLATGKEISVVASGCSVASAISLASKTHLNSLVFITPDLTFNDKENYKNLVDIPTYFINSSHHVESNKTSKELFAWSGSKQSKIQVFKGNYHDHQLMRSQKYLVNDIALWLKFNLK